MGLLRRVALWSSLRVVVDRNWRGLVEHVPIRRYHSSNVGHCMGERNEETSDVPGNPLNIDGKGFRPSPSQKNTYILPVHMR